MQKITNLTHQAVKNIQEDKKETLPLIVQIIELKESDIVISGAKIYKCTINDGFCQCEVDVVNLHPSIQAAVKAKKPVVSIKEYVKRRDLILIRQLESVNLDVKEQVGQPISFQSYKEMKFTNPHGTTEILVSKAPHQLKIQSKPKNSIKVEAVGNENNNSTQIQVEDKQQKTGQKLSLTQKTTQRPSIQRIENQIPLISDQKSMMIMELYPGIRGFKIKGRVTSKSEKTTFKSGKGYFFTIEIMDSDKQTIGGSFFNQTCDKFIDKIDSGKIYYFEGGQVKTNKYQSKSTNSSDYQITFEDFSKIVEADEDQAIQQCALECKTINDIEQMPLDTKCDFIGVVAESHKLTQITTKTNENRSKRTFTVFDQTQKGMDVTLWGVAAEKQDFKKGDIVAFRGLKITEYQGERGLTASAGTTFEKDSKKLEKIEGFKELYEFYIANKDAIDLRPREASKMKMKTSYIDQIEKDFEGKMDIKFQKFYEIRAYIGFISQKQNLHYDSCQDCHKKVTQQHNKQFFCQACNKYFDKPMARYIFQLKLVDTSGSFFVTANNTQGIAILKKSADEYLSLGELEKSYLLKRATNQQFRILIVGKVEQYNEITRPRFTIANIIADDFTQESLEMFNQLEEMLHI